MSIYSSEWKDQMTIDDVIAELTKIKEEFGENLVVYCHDHKYDYESLTQINVRSFTYKDGKRADVVCFDTV